MHSKMIQTFEFLKLLIDSISEHMVVIDQYGEIQFTNKAWDKFSQDNECVTISDWIGTNYLISCDQAAEMGDDHASKAASGIRQVINGLDSFYLEYPCHSPDEKRWFMMRATPFDYENTPYIIISHQNITERKLAEEQVTLLSRQDGLTGLANRRCFDEFLLTEWSRCSRLNFPITVAMLDLDHFKMLNDTYGHQSGDDCLVKISKVLAEFANRPGDICARYGGEEFVLVFGNSTTEQLTDIINDLQSKIRELKIPNENAPTSQYVTASIGVKTMVPDRNSSEKELLKAADKLLYSAKENGRNRVIYSN